MNDYQSYIDRLTKLRELENDLMQKIGGIKNKRFYSFRRKQKQQIEEAEEELRLIRSESERLCKMLDECLEREENKMQKQSERFWDEEPQEYNEVIGICYGKAILVTDSGNLLWFECNEADGCSVAIGDSELDDGLLHPLSALPAGEQKMILNYLIEAGSTPVHYLGLLKEKMNNI